MAGKIARRACDNTAQGCRFGGYPGEKEGKHNHTPKGFRRAALPTPTQPFQGKHDRGWPFSQGSRSERQPWAALCDPFGIKMRLPFRAQRGRAPKGSR